MADRIDDFIASYNATHPGSKLTSIDKMTGRAARIMNQVQGQGGGGFVQAGVAGINLETGQPINSAAAAPSGGGPTINTPDGGGYGGGGGGASTGGSGMGNYLSRPSQGGAIGMTPNTTGGMGDGGGPSGGMSGMGGHSAGSNSILQRLLDSLTNQSKKADDTNLAQYKALMQAIGGTQGTVRGMFDQLGAAGTNRINRNEQNQAGSMQQSLVSRGLGNTTIADTSMRGVARDAEQSRQELGSNLAAQKIGTELQLGDMYNSALQTRNATGPSMATYLSLIQKLARGA